MTSSQPIESAEDRRLDHYEKIKEMNEHVIELGGVAEEKRKDARNAREDYQQAMVALNELIAGGPDPQMRLAFRDVEDYRDVPVEDVVHIKPSVREKLMDSGVLTLGEIVSQDVSKIPGIGKSTAGHICKAVGEFFEDHPEYQTEFEVK